MSVQWRKWSSSRSFQCLLVTIIAVIVTIIITITFIIIAKIYVQFLFGGWGGGHVGTMEQARHLLSFFYHCLYCHHHHLHWNLCAKFREWHVSTMEWAMWLPLFCWIPRKVCCGVITVRAFSPLDGNLGMETYCNVFLKHYQCSKIKFKCGKLYQTLHDDSVVIRLYLFIPLSVTLASSPSSSSLAQS